MPRVRWGIKSSDIDNFDRDSQFTPYRGPTPPNAVYQWKIKVLKYVAATRDKNEQLRIGLELVPRKGRDEAAYKGYFIMAFLTITNRNQFTYVPFCDAIGVSGSDFTERMISDEEGNIKKIGRWRNDNKQMIEAQLKDGADQHGNPRKDIGWMGGLSDEADEDSDEYEEEIEEEDAEEIEEEDKAPAPIRTRQTAATRRSPTPSRRRQTTDEEDDPF